MSTDRDLSTDELDAATDEELVEWAQQGEYAAYEEIVRRYQDKAFRLAFSLMKNETDAQDVVQEAFLNMYRKLDTFKGQSAFGSWMYRVVVNAALMRLRKKKRRSEVPVSDEETEFREDDYYVASVPEWRVRADEAAENRELRQKIIEAVDELPPKYQTVFLLKEVEGLPLKEIADVLDLSVGGVKSRLHRARLHLRATLEPYLA
ncbi:RNA polymerase sigma factor [Persicimonas caeni]|nr:sigma-70 family RNA polymerase sigma factor [Persicimonas caeni]